MSILTDDLRLIEAQGHPACGLAAEEIENLEKGYELLYAAHTKACATVTKQAEAIASLVEALVKYLDAVQLMGTAMDDGVNVHGVISGMLAAEENARAALAKQREPSNG